jgi:hypothetical protein
MTIGNAYGKTGAYFHVTRAGFEALGVDLDEVDGELWDLVRLLP